jgi:hypothetical protein
MKIHVLLPAAGDVSAWEREFAASGLEGAEIRRVVRWSGGGKGGGPIREINAALEQALADQADLLPAARGCTPLPGSLPALLRAAAGDPMILALAPGTTAGA